MEPCRVAATQVDVRHLDVDHNVELHRRLIGETAAAGCDLVVFPELSVTGHNGSPEVIRFAEPHDGPIHRSVQRRAQACGIVVAYGFCELFRGTHYNTCALERILALQGAEVVLLPHAIHKLHGPDGSVTFDGAEREAPEEELLRFQRQLLEARPNPRLHDVLARDNGVFAVFSDQVGFDGHSTHVAGAYVIAPDGATIVRSEPGRETGWVAVDLEPELLRRVRENPWFALRKRRPETYEELTRPL
jgi:predicted amidohydrolase